nr:hypothetical protein [Bacteroidota bacterium]
MTNTIKLSALLILLLVNLAAYTQTDRQIPDKDKPATSPIQIAYENVGSWLAEQENDYNMLLDDVLSFEGQYIDQRVLLHTNNGQGYLFIFRAGWSVAICYLDKDLEVKDLDVFTAKMGYSVSWDTDLIITLHKHPGTDMFLNQEMNVGLKDGKLDITKS